MPALAFTVSSDFSSVAIVGGATGVDMDSKTEVEDKNPTLFPITQLNKPSAPTLLFPAFSNVSTGNVSSVHFFHPSSTSLFNS